MGPAAAGRPAAERVEVSREIAARPDVAYAAIADITRMGTWSPECYACEWQEGFNGAAVGAVFDGHNRSGEHEWTTQGTVLQADPGRGFVFECSMYGIAYARWGYEIEPTAQGCRVTEWTEDFRREEALEFSRNVSGVDARADRSRSAERNRRGMTTTLERLAQALEKTTPITE